MRLKALTKYFGEIEYTERELYSFPAGLFGFEEEKRFLLLPFEGDGSLLCLQSLATPALAFVMMDPFALDAAYAPVLQPEELANMEAQASEDLLYYALCAVKEPVSESTVNLQCPVAMNEDKGIAMQVILEDSPYHMRHRLSEFGTGGEASC